MRSHLRAAATVLIALLSLTQLGAVCCEAACGPEQEHAAPATQPTCHSTFTASGDVAQFEPVRSADCDHARRSDAVAAAQQDAGSLCAAPAEDDHPLRWSGGAAQTLAGHNPHSQLDSSMLATITPPLRI